MITMYLLFLLVVAPFQQPLVPIMEQTPSSPQVPASATTSQSQNNQAVGSTLQASAQYQFGPGDSFRAIVWNGNETLDTVINVAADGTALVPFSINKLLKIEGLTQTETRELILSELKKNYLNPVVQVIAIPNGIQSKKALLVTDAANGGRSGYFPITGEETVMEFVTQNGGYAPGANLADIRLTRATTGEHLSINLYDTLLKDDKTGYMHLEPNDIVYIPSLQTVSNKTFVIAQGKGAVVLQTPDKLTLLEALSRGNAFGTGSRVEDVRVVRLDPKDHMTPVIHQIDFAKLYEKGDFSVNIPLENGDIVFIPKSKTVKVSEILNAVAPVVNFVQTTIFFAAAFRTGG